MRSATCKVLAFLVACTVLTATAQAGQLVSSMRNVSAYRDYAGYYISPITTTVIPGDYAPAQVFELVRPSLGKISLGRLFTSCTCIQLSADKKTFGYGEQVLFTLRNVRPTNGKTYPFYVQVTSPIRATLRYDAYVISDQFVVAPPVEVTEVPADAIEVTEAVETPQPEPVVAEPEEAQQESPAPEAAPEEKAEAAPEEKAETVAEEKPAEEPAESPENEAESEQEPEQSQEQEKE